LKEFYWLKLNQFLLAARSASASLSRIENLPGEDQVEKSKEDALEALNALLHHAKACYGLANDEAA
jgi:hypothetical protein